MVEPLTREQSRALREQLQGRYDTLIADVRQELLQADNERYAELAGLVHDPGDESVADLISDLDLADIDRHIGELRDLEAAFDRVRRGEYGICVDCGDDIGFDRLHAYPTAKRCLPCQQRHERSYSPG
ncbi:MAG: TraR/DksA family transcriptional regulator [Gammaproteobacteria bacterium]|nr:TraR/DksA family transcriptional regulator [Gammaproteobacteria bacterium]